MTLDIATLFAAAVVLDFGIALYFWTLWLGRRGERIHLWVAASATSATVGCLLFMLRQVAPDWVAIWAAQVCFIQVFAFLWAAIRLVHARARPAALVWLGSAAWSVACLVPALFQAEQARNLVATLAFTAYCLAMSAEMLRPDRSRPTPNRMLAAGLLWLLSAASLGLAVYSALQEAVVAPLRQAPPWAALWLMLYLVIYIVLILAVTTLELGNEAERQRETATTDGLTGLLNRRAFRERAEGLAPRHRQMALLMLDIDHFKRINDDGGHSAGDAALVRFSALLRQVTGAAPTRGSPAPGSAGPVLARIGGEEFVCLLPGGQAADAARLAEAIRVAVEAAPQAEGRRGMTVSIGFAVAPSHVGMLDDLLRAADEALYRAKRAGRNRVEGAATLAPSTPAMGRRRCDGTDRPRAR